jgi:hypothetical protein
MIKKIAENQNWAKITPWMGLVTAVLLFWQYTPGDLMFWALVNIPLYLFHQFEEHYWPGGFKNYINHVINKLPEGEEMLTDIKVFWINIILVWLAFLIFGILSFYNIGFGLLIVIFSIINCLTHIVQGIKRMEWNPGLVMASLQFLLSVYGAYFITVNGLASPLSWWIIIVLFSVVAHAVLFKVVMSKK